MSLISAIPIDFDEMTMLSVAEWLTANPKDRQTERAARSFMSRDTGSKRINSGLDEARKVALLVVARSGRK